MSIRYAIAAILLSGGACVAHADVLPAGTSAQPGLLTGWISGNGTDIVSSGVLASGTTLIGGVAHGNDSLAQALYQKASANLGQSGSDTKLSYAQGIDGAYLTGVSNAKLAAALGNSVSVVGSGDNLVVSTGQTSANAGSGGSTGSTGGSTGSTGSGGGAAGGTGGTGGTGGAGGTGGTGGSAGDTGSTGGSGGSGSTGSTGGTGGTGSTGGTGGDGGSGAVEAPVPPPTVPVDQGGEGGTGGNGSTGGNGGSGGNLDAPADTPSAEVPEPSTMALLLAGVLGAVSLGRRRVR